MDISVQTGLTKSQRGTTLVSESLTSTSGEQVCMLVQVEAAPAEAKTLENEFQTVLKHALLETQGEASNRLDGSLKEVNGLLKGLILSQAVGEVHAILAIVDKSGVLHVSHAGRAEAYVIRGGAASQITEYTRGKPTPAFVHIASGALEPRDAIIFSTQRLLRTVTPAQLAQLAQRGDHLLEELVVELEAEKEQSAIAVLHVSGKGKSTEKSKGGKKLASRLQGRRRKGGSRVGSLLSSTISLVGDRVSSLSSSGWTDSIGSRFNSLLSDLKDPERKRRAHLLLLAGTVTAFLLIWAVVNLSSSTQSRQTRAELEERLEEISQLIRTAENRRLSGEIDSSNAILEQAEERAKQVMDNESNLYRSESLDLLERIRAKREQINNIVRLSPRLVVNLSSKEPDVDARGFIGLADGEFVAYDARDLYRVLLNSVDDPDRLVEEELILEGVEFPRYQTLAFQITDNSIIELINELPTSMKTEDPAGWIKGTDIKSYLRFLYILSPENNQIYKYERLSNRYSAPAEYNINGDLEGAIDMAIDGNVFILKEGGEIVKLLRGEVRPFTIRHMPDNALDNATKVYKVFDGHLYFLDPVSGRVIVATDGGSTGEASYVKQYVFEGDQIGELRDLYVDPDETMLYVIDEKRIHVVDLGTR